MWFSEKYKSLYSSDDGKIDERYFGNFTTNKKRKLISIIIKFDEPKLIYPDRYSSYSINTCAFNLVGDKLTELYNYNLFEHIPDIELDEYLCTFDLGKIFNIIECQWQILSNEEKEEFTSEINIVFDQNELPWKLCDGHLIKIDAQQFELDLKRKTLEKLNELANLEPMFKPTYNELLDALDFLNNDKYAEAINNANKAYESIMKVILNEDKGNANQLAKAITGKLNLPDAISRGFDNNVLMSLPYLRNNLSSHGAGKQDVGISKNLSNLSINLSCSLITFLISEFKNIIK